MKNKKIALIYSFHSVKTAKAAEKIVEAFGIENIEKINAETVTKNDFENFDHFILGVSTWFDGELPNYWDEALPELEDLDLSHKTAAIFGLGDQKGYPENFVDGIGILADFLENCGMKIIGFTSTEGYQFEKSKAQRNDQFCGLALDFENQAKLNDARILTWCTQIKNEFISS